MRSLIIIGIRELLLGYSTTPPNEFLIEILLNAASESNLSIEFHQVTILVIPRMDTIVSPRTSTCCSNTIGERSDGTVFFVIEGEQEVCLQDFASLLKLYSINRAVQGAVVI